MKTLFIPNEKRKAIFRYFLLHPSEIGHIRKSAAALSLAPSFVSSFVKRLEKNGMVRNNALDISEMRVRAWSILFNMEILSPVISELARLSEARGMGLYGSFAKGTNNADSDIDIWLLVDTMPSSLTAAKVRDLITRKTGFNSSPLFITKEKAQEMRSADPSFYYSLANSFHLWGDGFD
jgi:predicted nucleotidyltransferase